MEAKSKKDRNVPNLRFAGFQNEWEEKKLQDIAKFFSGGTPQTTIKEYYDGTIPFIRSGEINSNTTELLISEKGLKNSSAKLVNKGDLLIALYGATSGEIAISKICGAINQAILCIDTQENKKFLKGIWLKHTDKILQNYLQGGQGNLSADIVKRLKFHFPTIPEQNKIADFLSLLDLRISTQSQIIDNLQSLIKTTCKVYHKSVEKNEYTIADLGRSFRAMNLSKEDLSTEGEKCILYGELFTTYDCVIDKVVSFTNNNSSQKTLSGENDLLFPASTTVDALSLISTSAISIKNIILGGDMFGISLHKNNNNEYLSYVINYVYKRDFAKYAQGSTIIHLHYNDIKNVKIMLPSLKAQAFLADLMRLLRNKIKNEQKLLSAYQKQKKYLLSNMFI